MTQSVVDAMINKHEIEATAIANSEGYSTRRVNIDGAALVVTRDIRSDRVSLTLEKGIVVGAKIG